MQVLTVDKYFSHFSHFIFLVCVYYIYWYQSSVSINSIIWYKSIMHVKRSAWVSIAHILRREHLSATVSTTLVYCSLGNRYFNFIIILRRELPRVNLFFLEYSPLHWVASLAFHLEVNNNRIYLFLSSAWVYLRHQQVASVDYVCL